MLCMPLFGLDNENQWRSCLCYFILLPPELNAHFHPVCIAYCIFLVYAKCTLTNNDHVAARSRMNGLIPFERTVEQTTETMSLAPNRITNRITSLGELLHFHGCLAGLNIQLFITNDSPFFVECMET